MLDALALDASTDPDIEGIRRLDIVPKILDVICLTTGMGFAAVARVTADRWVACAVRDDIAFGLAVGGELELNATICNEIRSSGEAVVIDHVAEDLLWRDHHTPARYGFQSYISTPILRGGEFFGTLCAIDPRPAALRDSATLATFELFAELIGQHLDAQDRLARAEAALLDAQEAAELREQFIAVLGHDLRNPLQGVSGGARLLQRAELPDRERWILDQMQSSVGRMAALINDVMDFARGRLGGGFQVERIRRTDLSDTLTLVVGELRAAHPDRTIDCTLALDLPVVCDGGRLAQLASNLLSNALTHGAADAPVRLNARTGEGEFELVVANAGDPIPAPAMAGLFQPFVRANARQGQQGLGLGLYIASEIARAHDGSLTALSDAAETRFTFRMPLGG